MKTTAVLFHPNAFGAVRPVKLAVGAMLSTMKLEVGVDAGVEMELGAIAITSATEFW